MDELVRERLSARELAIHAERRANGLRFLGMDVVRRCNPNGRPGTCEPRRRRNPRIAARDVATRVTAIAARREFLSAYREAYRELGDGT